MQQSVTKEPFPTKYIDTPAGKFQIFLNGIPVGFDAESQCPYTYHDNSSTPVPILACYRFAVDIQALAIGDVIEAKYEYGILKCGGGGEGTDNAVESVGDYVVGIGAAGLDAEHFS